MTANDFTPYGRVYLITNSANGKRYVGQTIKTLELRFRQHCQLQAKCRALESAISKYGAENFLIAELATAKTQDELNDLEARYIRELSTVAPGGYNLRDGGGSKGAMHPETKKIMSMLARSPARLAALQAMRQRPDVAAKRRVAAVAQWQLAGEAVIAASQTPEAQAKRTASLRGAYQQPELLEHIRKVRAEVAKRPESKDQKREQMAARWAAMTAEQRQAEGRKISAALLGHKKNIDYSPEAKAHRKQIAAKRWEDPAYREAMLRASSDPDLVKRRGDAIRAGWAKRRERLAAEKAGTT